MSKLPSETFCVLPFMHMAATPAGSFRVCCNSNPKNNKIWKTPDKEYKLYRDDVEEVWNSPDYKRIRKQFIDGERPETCQRCFREEDSGSSTSPRIAANKHWMRDDIQIAEEIPLDIRYVDIRLGNLCNLKCRMCNPWSSSMWVKDWNSVVGTAELQPNVPLTDEEVDFMDFMGVWPDRKGTAKNFQTIAHTVEEIYLTGGEPTLAKSQYDLLDYCIQNELAGGIKLKYNTNLTNVPDKMLEYWTHFKGVQLSASIDAVGERDRYIRYPSSWEKIEEHFDKLKGLNNIDLQVHSTVQILNVCALHELIEWVKSKDVNQSQIHYNILNHPECMNIRALPKELKQLAEQNLSVYEDDRINNVIKYMWAEDWHVKRWQEFLVYNKKIDSLQNMSLLDACPELKDYV